MKKHVIEIVKFRLGSGVSDEGFRTAAESINAFLAEQPGFVARRLSVDSTGEWADHVEWLNMDDATHAAAALATSDLTQEFMGAIDMASLVMGHSELVVSAG